MEFISETLKSSREEKGISVLEVASDLKITKEEIEAVENIKVEEFEDIYKLKDLIYDYAKYLGLDVDAIMDEFNEYMFRTTSRIPTDVIERISKQKENEEKGKEALSPYTEDLGKYKDKKDISKMVPIIIIACILVLCIMLFLFLN